MKTKKDFLLKALIDGNNSFDLERDKKITEDVLVAMEMYTKSKIKAKAKAKNVTYGHLIRAVQLMDKNKFYHG